MRVLPLPLSGLALTPPGDEKRGHRKPMARAEQPHRVARAFGERSVRHKDFVFYCLTGQTDI